MYLPEVGEGGRAVCLTLRQLRREPASALEVGAVLPPQTDSALEVVGNQSGEEGSSSSASALEVDTVRASACSSALEVGAI